jgi:hypothetical protein
LFVAGLAACSGNLGGGQSTLPGGPMGSNNSNVQQITPPATPTPVSASNVASLGDTVAPQALPTVMGYGGSIAFPKPIPAPSPSPNSKATVAPSDDAPAGPISVGVTAAVVEPSDAPHFNPASAKKHAKHDPAAPTPLLFISLLATADVTLGQYPSIAVNVPRDIYAKHRGDTFGLALYDPEQKGKVYQLAVALRDLSSPPPGSQPTVPPTAAPSPTPTPTATPFGNFQTSFTPPPVGSGLGSSGTTLPPERVAFQTTAAILSLKADRPVVFALYALAPQPSPSPSPSVGPSPAASGSPSPSPSPSP